MEEEEEEKEDTVSITIWGGHKVLGESGAAGGDVMRGATPLTAAPSS